MNESDIMEYLKTHNGSALQRDISENLNIDRSRCSKMVVKLEKNGMVKREWTKVNGSRTYLITYTGKRDRYYELLSDGVIAPCAGCNEDCFPDSCMDLEHWLFICASETSDM